MRRTAGIALPLACMAIPAAAHAPVGSDAAACVDGGPAIRVDILGLKDRTGRLKLELYPANDDDFLKDDTVLKRQGRFFHRVWASPPASGPVAMCIRTPGAGRYALLFTHDRDGRNKFHFWQDGVGVPGNRRLGRSRPRLADAQVYLSGGVTQLTIRAQYLRGFSGFAPYEPTD